MYLYLLFAICIAFTILNFFIARKDYMSPGVVFSFVFAFGAFMCVLEQPNYKFTLRWQVVFVITMGLFAFTLVSWLVEYWKEKKLGKAAPAKDLPAMQPIHVAWWISAGVVLLQLAAIFFFIRYLDALALAGHVSGGLTDKIDYYNVLTKFDKETLNMLHVSVPMVYRIANPLAEAGAYVLIYVQVHNWSARHKIEPVMLVSTLLLCVLIFLNGSRTPLFRVLTMFLILYYLFDIQTNPDPKVKWRFLYTLAGLLLAAVILFLIMVAFMRNIEATKLLDYIFIYTGAPIVNLDLFLTGTQRFNIGSPQFAGQTFRNFYEYLAKLTGNSFFLVPDYLWFNDLGGKSLGNVYTMFFNMAIDFGFWGIIPFTALMALYYNITYAIITVRQKFRGRKINFNVFIYAYLFNDLVMSGFASRFYETIGDAPFIKIFILSFCMIYLLINPAQKKAEKVQAESL